MKFKRKSTNRYTMYTSKFNLSLYDPNKMSNFTERRLMSDYSPNSTLFNANTSSEHNNSRIIKGEN